MARYTVPTSVRAQARPDQNSNQNSNQINTDQEVTMTQLDEHTETEVIEPDGLEEILEDLDEADEATCEAEDTDEADEADETDEADEADGADEEAEAEEQFNAFAERAAELVENGYDTAAEQLDAEVIAEVKKLYNDIEGMRAKRMARDWAEQQMLKGVSEGNLIVARAYMELHPHLKATQAAKKPKAPRVQKPEDLIPFYAERIAELDLARQLIVIPEKVIDGDELADKLQETATSLYTEKFHEAQQYVAYLQGEGQKDDDGELIEPAVEGFVKTAARLALGMSSRAVKKPKAKQASGPRAPRRNVRDHINEVFADLAVGTFLKVNEITEAQTSVYGTDRPSPGAITFNLNSPKFANSNIQPAEVDGVLGARKVK